MANPITVFNTDILTTTSSVEYNGASGVNVDNENRIISLDESAYSAVSSVENKMDTSSYHELSAGVNIGIQDYVISSKDWTTDISNASSYAYNQATAQIPSEFDPTYMSGQIDNKLDKSESANYYPSTANPSGYLVPNDITALANKSDLTYVSGKVDSISSELSGAIDNKLEKIDFNIYSVVVNNQITALRDGLDTVSTNTGYLYNDLTSTSAGLSGALDFVSGSLTSKQDKLTEEQLSAISSISSLDGKFYPLNENPSGYLVQSDLNGYATTSQTDYLSATITSNSSDFSGYIDYLSGHAGKTYEGVLPISVDNTNNEISISSTPFSVQEPLYFVKNTNTSVVVGFSGDTFGGAKVNIPLTGDGTTENPIGLMSYISWGGNGTTSTFSRSGVRVLDQNNNSAYYLASGLNLNNETITDSAISSWNDARTTVETNSANWGGINSVDTNHGISGDGTTSSPIGIASSFQLENPSVYTTATYKGDSVGIVGLMPRMQLKKNDSSYNTLGEGGMTITHSASGVGGGYTTSHYGSVMRLSYNDGDYYLHTMDTTKSGLGVAYKGNSNVKAYYNYSGVALTNDNGATNEYVNVSSIRNWNGVYDTVSSNSANWGGGGGGGVDTIPFVVQSPLTTGFTGDSAYIGIDSTAINLSSYVPYSALTTSYSDSMITNINGSSLYVNSARRAFLAQTAQMSYGDRNGNEITSYYQPKLTIGGENNTITSINSSAIGSTNTATWELVEGNNISIVDDVATSSTTISVSGMSATEWNDTYTTVNTNSGTWGGSALNISAGNGVKAELVDNTLVFSNDETVLFDGNITATNSTGALREPPSAFNDLRVEWYGENTTEYGLKCNYFHNDGLNFTGLACGGLAQVYSNYAIGFHFGMLALTNDKVTLVRQARTNFTTGTIGAFTSGNGMFRLQRIVGINRINNA